MIAGFILGTIDDGDEFTIVIPESQLDDLPPLLASTFQVEYGYRFVKGLNDEWFVGATLKLQRQQKNENEFDKTFVDKISGAISFFDTIITPI